MLKNRILNEIRRNGYSQADIANIIGVSPSVLNRMINGTRTFTIKALDDLTNVLGLPCGYFYQSFFDTYWNRNKKRVFQQEVNFVINCTRCNLFDLADAMINKMMNGCTDAIFEIAEDLFAKEQFQSAIFIYEKVIENEKHLHSERLALCHYRIFLIKRNRSLETATWGAVVLSQYLPDLEGAIRLEAYEKVITVMYILDKWAEVETFAQQLQELSVGIDKNGEGMALIYRSIAARKQKRYADALELIRKYEEIKGIYGLWAVGNRLIVEIEAGNIDKITELEYFLESNPLNHWEYAYLLIEMYVNNRMYNKLNYFLDVYGQSIDELRSYPDPLSKKRLINIYYHLAICFIQKGEVSKGINYALNAFEMAAHMTLRKEYAKLMDLLYKFKELSSKEQQDRCRYILSLVGKI